MAVLTIDLEDQASQGLADFNANLNEFAQSCTQVEKTTDRLTAAHERQVKVIQQEDVSYRKLADTGVRVFGDLGSSGIKAFEGITVASIKAEAAVTNTLIKTGGSIIKWGFGAAGAVGVANAAFGGHAKAVDKSVEAHERFLGISKANLAAIAGVTAAVASNTTATELAEKAAVKMGLSVGRVVTGMGGYLAGAGVGWEIYGAVIDRTGRKFKGLTEDISNQTKDQAAAFEKFKNEANELGITLDALAESRGAADVNKYLEQAFGVKTVEQYESNLDREKAAIGRFVTFFSDASSAIASDVNDWWMKNEGWRKWFNDNWKEFDEATTRGTDTFVHNFDQMTESLYKFFGLNPKTSSIFKLFDQTKDDFARIEVMDAQIAEADEKRAEVARIASIKTVEGIKAELDAWETMRAEKAAGNSLDQATADKMFRQREALITRQMQIEKEQATAKQNFHSDRVKQIGELNALEEKQMEAAEAHAKRVNALFDAEQKRRTELARMFGELTAAQANEKHKTNLDQLGQEHDAAKATTMQRLQARGATEAEIKKQLGAMDKAFNESTHAARLKQIDDEARAKTAQLIEQRDKVMKANLDAINHRSEMIKIEEQAAKIAFERNKQLIAENANFQRQQMHLTFKLDMEQTEAKLKAEKDRIEKVKQASREAMQGFDLQQVLDASNPDAVFSQFRKNRQQQSMQNQADKDRDIYDRAMGGDKRALRQYEKNQRAAMARGGNQADSDWMNGNVQQSEVTGAQAGVAQQTIAGMQKQGLATDNQAQVIGDQLKILADQQTVLNGVLQFQQKMIAFQKGIKNQAQAAVTTIQNQQGSLN